MITLSESFEFICSHFGMSVDEMRSLGTTRKDTFKKKIAQLLLRSYFKRNATFKELAELFGLTECTIFQSINTGQGWLDTNYIEFQDEYKKAETEFKFFLNSQPVC